MAMKRIEVDIEVYRELQKRARPFEDTPNTVLRRLLGLEAKPTPPPRRRKRAAPGELMPQSEYRRPILETLSEMGGRARMNDVLQRVFEKVQHQLKPADLMRTKSGEIRWRNRVCWVRYELVQEGLLRSDSPRGIWELSEKGRAYLHQQR